MSRCLLPGCGSFFPPQYILRWQTSGTRP
jgi:hypothetical protein